MERPSATLQRPTAVLRRDGEQPPLARHAFELVSAAVVEFEPGPDHQVAQRAGHQHIVGPGECADPCTDVSGDPADVVAAPGCLTLLLHSGRADQRPAEF